MKKKNHPKKLKKDKKEKKEKKDKKIKIQEREEINSMLSSHFNLKK